MDKSKKRLYLLVIIGLFTVVSLIISHILTLPKKQVVFDMKGTVNLFIDQVHQKNLSEEDINQISAKFNLALDNAIQAYSRDENVIIFVNAAVVAGLDDITPDIQALISEKMSQ